MDIRVDQTLAPQQAPVISYRQIAAVRLLQLSSQELEATIEREQVDNPAMEAEMRPCCPRCNAALESPLAPCPICGASAAATSANDHTSDAILEMECPTTGVNIPDDDADDPMMRLAATMNPGEALLQSLCLTIDDDDMEIAEYIVGSLDDHGFLAGSIVEDAADALGCAIERVAVVLDALQRLDPPGIGARGAQECLLIQLRRLREQGEERPLAELLVRDHLKDLAFRRFREVAHTIGQTPKKIEAEWEFIRDTLHPYPAHGFDPNSGQLATSATPVRPDVVIRRTSEGFVAEVVERQRYLLRVNPEYLWARKQIAAAHFDEATRTHIRSYVDQAQSFISALRQRWNTMQRVSDALINAQRDYLEQGPSALKPLTRADVARQIGLHESTVSRATDGKFVLLPNGRAVPFDDFFDSSLPIKNALCEILAAENPRRPYSDEQLTRLLEDQRIIVARRTIAKYREELGILPSRLRRSQSGTLAGTPAGTPAVAASVAAPAPQREAMPALPVCAPMIAVAAR
ncbi:MAG: RNA polymerase factor sigma-54 [Ktedonobacterales bacterium]